MDPRIDTSQTRWILFASASRPFGMVSLSPDTKLAGDWGAGYIYVEPYIRDFDVGAAYAGARKNAFPGGIRDRAGYEFGPNPQGGGMPDYVERGWIRAVPGTKGFHRAGAAQTLENAYQDWCLAQFAKGLGRQDDYAAFMTRSANWKNLFTYADAPWLTQYWVRRVKDEAYGGTTPSTGYNGDEDQGQLGGLGVLMAMGLFDVTGGAAARATSSRSPSMWRRPLSPPQGLLFRR